MEDITISLVAAGGAVWVTILLGIVLLLLGSHPPLNLTMDDLHENFNRTCVSPSPTENIRIEK